ncbi:DinB family protein [Paenibacillus daejeonensis]|uniref:DinB family protein n=1 Tax=Paenibacillus daejeonensis TaxID=135193 RepID=UPI00036284BB|nr:DinB family protein [Paenibacillus daejeonensis]
MTTPTTLQQTLQYQYAIACQLCDYHLTDLTEDEYHWRPAPPGLHIAEHSGVWQPDWPTSEGYDIGPPSSAWLMWHMTYWWSMVLDHTFGQASLQREDIPASGSFAEAKSRLLDLRNQWEGAVHKLSPEAWLDTARTRWPFADRSFADLAAWLNVELMKNASELGYSRFLYGSQANYKSHN